MGSPDGLRFLKSHEWASSDGNEATVGISQYAVDQLNREIVFLELPEVGRELRQGDSFGVVEAVKAASDIYAPVSGRISAVNAAVVDNPGLLGEEPFGEGWLVRIEMSDTLELENLLSAADYDTMTASEEPH